MIIVLRGTNGSGKSFAMRTVLAQATERRALSGGINGGSAPGVRIRIPQVKRPVVIVGPYDEERSMGGCDCIRQPTQIYGLVEWAMDHGCHVALEGVVLATKPWFEYLSQGEDVRYGFLDTPTNVCLLNIAARQARKGRVVRVSERAMRLKWNRAHDMYNRAIRTKSPGMLAERLHNGNAAAKWMLKQLRNP